MFCPLPFNEFQVGPKGDVHCCCEAWLPTPLGNVLRSSPQEIWNGEIARSIRTSVLDGSFKFCVRCPFLPGPAGPIVARPIRVAPPGRIHTLVLNYDRSCNLACPSCRREHVYWPADDPIVSRVHSAILKHEVLRDADRLYVSGSGDPLASPTFYRLLQDLPNLPHSPRLSVVLLTNGLLLDEQHWISLGATREMVSEINVSIDAATEDTYLLNRGGSWKKLWNNLEFVHQLRTNDEIARFTTYFVAQDNNFLELVPFIEKCLGAGADAINVLYIDHGVRNQDAFDKDEYRKRAVHLPEHPHHELFRAVMSNPRIANDARVVLPTFPPRVLE